MVLPRRSSHDWIDGARGIITVCRKCGLFEAVKDEGEDGERVDMVRFENGEVINYADEPPCDAKAFKDSLYRVEDSRQCKGSENEGNPHRWRLVYVPRDVIWACDYCKSRRPV